MSTAPIFGRDVAKRTFCMKMSARMESGMVRLRASVPMSDDVRKQPLRSPAPTKKTN